MFEETAARMGVASAVAIEKDYWVCWTLKRLFESPLIPDMVFKGGTSLSKVYRAIERFSEDIDLSIPRAALGFSAADDPGDGRSKTQASLLVKRMRTACDAYVLGPLQSSLNGRITQALGRSTRAVPWQLAAESNETERLRFTYPGALSSDAYGVAAYIAPSVLLEFGGRADVWPAEDAVIQPYCTELIPELRTQVIWRVHVLAAERTFWEKATLVHAEYYRFKPGKPSRRISRHYADLARLTQGEVGSHALDRIDLLRAVAEHKAHFFPTADAHFGEAASGIVHVAPPSAAERSLRDDYARMRAMFFREPVDFGTIVQQLRELEAAIRNRATAWPTRPARDASD